MILYRKHAGWCENDFTAHGQVLPRNAAGLPLTLEVFDHDRGSKHDFLGQVRLQLGGRAGAGGKDMLLREQTFRVHERPDTPGTASPGRHCHSTLSLSVIP